MHLTAALNSFLVLVGGAEGSCVLLPALLEGRWLGEIWQLPVGGVHGENLVSLALFMESPRARAPTLLGSILGQSLTTVYDVLDSVTVTTSRNPPPPPILFRHPTAKVPSSPRVSSRTRHRLVV